MDLLGLKAVRSLSSEVRDGVRIVKAEVLLQHAGHGYGFEITRGKLLYGKRGQVIDLDGYDGDDSLPAGPFRMRHGKICRIWQKGRQDVGKATSARTAFPRVDRLTDEGCCDVGNDAIAKELTPSIEQFSRTS